MGLGGWVGWGVSSWSVAAPGQHTCAPLWRPPSPGPSASTKKSVRRDGHHRGRRQRRGRPLFGSSSRRPPRSSQSSGQPLPQNTAGYHRRCGPPSLLLPREYPAVPYRFTSQGALPAGQGQATSPQWRPGRLPESVLYLGSSRRPFDVGVSLFELGFVRIYEIELAVSTSNPGNCYTGPAYKTGNRRPDRGVFLTRDLFI
mmetsp:Transcript_31736/g.71394  ORF Transcript_31736/g.71394 Transcript_31736/m.71394 type:complete len:200 (+) Transcript_31736:1761-2360(+)